MERFKSFVRLFLLPVALILVAVVWSGGCLQPTPNKSCVRPKVLVFTAAWCDNCKQDRAAVIQVKAMGVDVQVIDVDARPDLAKKYGVVNVPTYFVEVCGKETQRTNNISVVVNLMRLLFQ